MSITGVLIGEAPLYAISPIPRCTLANTHTHTHTLLSGNEAMETDLGSGLYSNGRLCLLPQCVHTYSQSCLGCQGPRDLPLVLGCGLAHQGGVVDDAILWRVVLGLQGSKQCLLSAKYLDSGRRMLGQTYQGTYRNRN